MGGREGGREGERERERGREGERGREREIERERECAYIYVRVFVYVQDCESGSVFQVCAGQLKFECTRMDMLVCTFGDRKWTARQMHANTHKSASARTHAHERGHKMQI